MQREQIVFVGTSDLSGHFRGKSFPVADLPARVERGVGLAPSNLFLSAFGPIHTTPFGTAGEVFLVPTLFFDQSGDLVREFRSRPRRYPVHPCCSVGVVHQMNPNASAVEWKGRS